MLSLRLQTLSRMSKSNDAAELLKGLAAGNITPEEFKERAQQFKPKAWLFKYPGGKYSIMPWSNSGEAPSEEREVSRSELPALAKQYHIPAIISFSGEPPVLSEEDLPEPPA